MELNKLLNKLYDIGDIKLRDYINDYQEGKKSLNDLCSIDSGFWQFVCEKCLYERDCEYIQIWENRRDDEDGKLVAPLHLEYRLMLSSIQPDKAKFICDNIKL